MKTSPSSQLNGPDYPSLFPRSTIYDSFNMLSVRLGEMTKDEEIRYKKNSIDVVFVNEDGAPVSLDALNLIKAFGLPPSARMPSGEIAHKILFGKSGPLLAVVINTKKKMALSAVRKAGGQIVRALEKHPYLTANIHMDSVFAVPGGKAKVLQAFLHGLQAATYSFVDFKSKKKNRALRAVAVRGHGISLKEARRIEDFVEDIVRAEHYSRKWIDFPAQEGAMGTDDLVRLAQEISVIETNVAIEVISGNELNKRGLNALWSVGNGRTDSPPALVVLHYKGAGAGNPKVALVGKGIVFDTGGENLKTGNGIDGMHADMGGAAMVLATIQLAARRKAKMNLIAALAIADNSVSGSSYHPRSVLRSYRGKTIEVLNTDAEGRLVLADAVSYTEDKYEPDYLITIATLTGACVIALGNEFAGLFAKSEKMAEIIKEASELTWNKVWRMPLFEAEHTNLKPSAIADVANIGNGYGGATIAAKFILEEFALTEHAAHLDVAGVAASILGSAMDATGEKCTFSTGWGPALLWETVCLLSK